MCWTSPSPQCVTRFDHEGATYSNKWKCIVVKLIYRLKFNCHKYRYMVCVQKTRCYNKQNQSGPFMLLCNLFYSFSVSWYLSFDIKSWYLCFWLVFNGSKLAKTFSKTQLLAYKLDFSNSVNITENKNPVFFCMWNYKSVIASQNLVQLAKSSDVHVKMLP